MSVLSDVYVSVNGNPDILKLMSTLNSYCLRTKSILYIAIFSLIFILCKIATTFRHGDFNKKSRTSRRYNVAINYAPSHALYA